MSNLSGIKDAEYLAQFLGKKIAIKSEVRYDKYYIFPLLSEIHYDGRVIVKDTNGLEYEFTWEDCFNPYVILLEPNIKWEAA